MPLASAAKKTSAAKVRAPPARQRAKTVRGVGQRAQQAAAKKAAAAASAAAANAASSANANPAFVVEVNGDGSGDGFVVNTPSSSSSSPFAASAAVVADANLSSGTDPLSGYSTTVTPSTMPPLRSFGANTAVESAASFGGGKNSITQLARLRSLAKQSGHDGPRDGCNGATASPSAESRPNTANAVWSWERVTTENNEGACDTTASTTAIHGAGLTLHGVRDEAGESDSVQSGPTPPHTPQTPQLLQRLGVLNGMRYVADRLTSLQQQLRAPKPSPPTPHPATPSQHSDARNAVGPATFSGSGATSDVSEGGGKAFAWESAPQQQQPQQKSSSPSLRPSPPKHAPPANEENEEEALARGTAGDARRRRGAGGVFATSFSRLPSSGGGGGVRWPGAHDEEGVTSPLTPRHERQRLVTLRSMALAASASSLPTSPSGSGASTDPTDSSLLRLRTLAELNISTPQRDSAPQQPQPQQEQQMRHHRDPMSSSNSGGGGGAECGGGGGDTPSLSEGEHQQSGGAPFSRLLEMRRRVALAKYSPFMPPLDTEHVAPPDAMTLPPPASSLSSSSPPAIRTLPSPVRSGAQHDEEESQASVGRLKRWSFGMDLQPIPTSSASTPFPQPTLTSAYPSSSTAINGAREESEDVTRPSQRRRVEEGTSNVAANNEREEEPGERTLPHPPSAGTAPYKRSSANEEDEAERAEVVPTRGGSRGGGSGTRTATRSPPRTGKANSQSSSASPKETKPAAENGDTASITVAPSAPPTGGAKRPPAKRAPKAASRKVMKAARTPPKAAGATAKTPNKAVGSQNPGRALPLRRGSGGLVVSSTLDAPTSPGRLSKASLRSEDLSTPLRSQLLDTRESVARYQTIANEPAASAFGQVGRNDLLRAIRASTAGTASSSGSTYAIPAPRSVQLAAAAASSKRAGVTSPIISPSSQGTPSWTAVAPIYLTNPDLAFNSNTWTRVPPAPPATLPVPPPRGIAASTQRVAEADHGAGGRRCVVFDTCSLIDSEPGVMNLLTERWVVCIPYTVIDELDNLNKGKIVARGKLAEDGGNSQREWRTRRARELRNWISALQAKKSDALRIQKRTEIVDAYDRRTANNDDTILGFAVYLKRRRESVMFVSEDKFLRIKATTELGETFCFADIKRMLGVRP